MSTDSLEQARTFFLQALQHHNHDRYVEAEALYRSAHALMPDRVSVLVNLAAVLARQQRPDEALGYCERALAIEPGNADALSTRALCRRGLSDPQLALRVLDQAIAADPQDAEAHNNRGVMLRELGRLQDALDSYDRALAVNPGQPGVLSNRGGVLAGLGRTDDALTSYQRALRIEPQFAPAGEGFAWLLTQLATLPAQRDAHFEDLLIRAICEPWARPSTVAPVLVALLHADPALARDVERVANEPADGPPDSAPGGPTPAVFANALLIALLENAPVADRRFEHWLGRLRPWLMAQADGVNRAVLGPADGGATAHPLVFHCALARQCFLTEYIHAATPSELARARRLQKKVATALANEQRVSSAALASVASYFPLHELSAAARLLDRPWPPAVDALLTQQLREPFEERRLRATIPRLTDVEDPVSLQVRQQYEENPYPRWVSTPRVHRSQSLQAYLQGRVPGARWRGTGDRNDVQALNAGCGTGQNPIETAQRITGIDVLAIDLSMASLAYAARMAHRLDVHNVQFAQADILQLASISGRFDLIESTGVLHHLHHPAQGLAALCSLLKPDGVMKLALYSQAARRSVAAAQALVAARGYGANAQDIRRCRAEILQLDGDAPERPVSAFTDFHSLSECRDLLLHVQEHRFTIGQLQTLLSDAGLEFIGFETATEPAAEYAKPPGDAPSPLHLEGWDAFEARHPDTFAGMYQFWVQKSVVDQP